MFFPFLAGKLMSRNLKWFIGRYSKNRKSNYRFLAAFVFIFVFVFVFLVLYQWPKFQLKIRSEKYVSDVGSLWTPLDH